MGIFVIFPPGHPVSISLHINREASMPRCPAHLLKHHLSTQTRQKPQQQWRRRHHLLLLVVIVVLNAGGAGAANFFVTNQCPFPVWPGAIPAGGGTQLNPGQTWLVTVSAGTAGGRIWGRTGCYFVGDRGGCATGDCAGARSCALSGKPPATLVEFSVGADAGAQDFFDVSVVDGFNLPMDFRCITGGGDPIRCRKPGCADASHPGDARVRTCSGNSDYQVTFCPA